MGWRTRVLDCLLVVEAGAKSAVTYATQVRTELDNRNSKGSVRDLDEAVRALLDVQSSLVNALQAANDSLAEIYNSCGPFFPKKE